jgi:rhamnosyltransferase
MKISAAVIIYHPDTSFLERIVSYFRYVTTVYVFDNTEGESEVPFKDDLLALGNVRYFHDRQNQGIAMRLNQAAALAIQEGFEWLLTMDQDSFFPDNTFGKYLDCIETYHNKSVVGSFGIQYLDKNVDPNICSYLEVQHLITSGSVINLDNFQKIGVFDEELFIDKVDHEYCLRTLLKGFKNICCRNVYLQHSLGKTTYGRSLKTFKLSPRTVHSPARMYYIIRNYFHLRSKFKQPQFADSLNEMKEELWIRTKNNFLYGTGRLSLIKYLIKGYLDYRKGKMGKLHS